MFEFIPKRYIFSLVGLSATTIAILLQSNLSMAIVYMIQRSDQNSTSSKECVEIPDHKGILQGSINW
ncbi:hypothetical protein CEXT_225391 [Caerostris extrusa]|uniref:Uncharacterized protein n=1 Tax=Caerostris extrusa TaxID=172846 RepID=A0AAV4TV66_CAEEX|nr:hypothetical protein CEXT_225391 [Caerostris extrusa]